MSQIFRLSPYWIAWGFLISVLQGADFPAVENVVPGVGQRGTRFTCKFIGAGLDGVDEVVLYSPGLSAKQIESVSENECLIEFEAAANILLGSHSLRLRTAQGLSALHRLRITPLAITKENEPNNTLGEAQSVPLSSTLAGTMESGDVDCFAVELQQGERLAVDVEGVRMGGTLLDTILKVFAPDGRLLAEVDDTALNHQDPCASIIAPVAGRYVVQIHESSFEGSDNSRYAVHIGAFPLPTCVFPSGGQSGKNLLVTWGGDASGEFSQTIQLPVVSEPTDVLVYAEQNGLRSPLAIPVRVAPFASHGEHEPNNESPHASVPTTEFPCGIDGCLQSAGDVDQYSVRCQAGQVYRIESFAWRIGSPVDTVLQLFDKQGQLLLASDDVDSHDSQMTFAARTTDDYHLKVFDKRGKGGVHFVYRIEATLEEPRLTAFLPRAERLTQEWQTLNVPRGNRVLARLGCRREGVAGDVRLVPSGLPDGVGFTDILIPEDRYWMPVVVEAADHSKLSCSLVELKAYGETQGRPLTGTFQQSVDLVTGTGETVYETATVDRLAVAVVEPAAFRVSLKQPQAPLAQAGTLGLLVTIEREADFKDAVEVSLPFFPPWVDGPASITIPADTSTATYLLHAHPEAEVRSWPLCVVAKPARGSARESGTEMTRIRGSRGRAATSASPPVCSELVTLDIVAPPIVGQLVNTDCEQGRSSGVQCRLQVTGEIPKQIIATLRGLPNRVTAPSAALETGAQQVVFNIQLQPDAPLGKFPDLNCELSGSLHGDQVTYTVALGSTMTIHAPGQLVLDDNGRPLSPLDLLKRKLTDDSAEGSR